MVEIEILKSKAIQVFLGIVSLVVLIILLNAFFYGLGVFVLIGMVIIPVSLSIYPFVVLKRYLKKEEVTGGDIVICVLIVWFLVWWIQSYFQSGIN